MILLVGVPGNIGSPLLEELLTRKAELRVLVHNAARGRQFKERGLDVVIGDMSDPQSLAAALAGVAKVFFLSPAVAKKIALETALVDAAQAAGNPHLVKISALGADRKSVADFMRQHGEVEEYILASGLPYTFLRPNLFMQNLVPFYGQSIAETGMFYVSASDARIGWVDARDIASVAAHALLEPGHEGKAYPITGPESLSYNDVATKLSTLLGKTVQYVPISDDVAYQSMVGAGMPEWNAQAVVTLNKFYRMGGGDVVERTVKQITGQEPRTMEAYLRENLAGFGG
jgi:uncharacterized protein YbjT (DUF2867 family)